MNERYLKYAPELEVVAADEAALSNSIAKKYPPIFLTTNRTDDRIHPGHARKMTAALQALGYKAWFNEMVAGGHSGALDNQNRRRARRSDLRF